jgi:hypothetical protein
MTVAGCGDGTGSSSDADATVDRRGAALSPTLVVVNGLDVGVSISPGIGTAADSRIAQPGGSVEAVGDTGACVGIARAGAVVRVAMLMEGGRMKAGTPAKCTDPDLGDVVVTWTSAEFSGARTLESLIPDTQLCLERQGPLEVQARIEPVGTAC